MDEEFKPACLARLPAMVEVESVSIQNVVPDMFDNITVKARIGIIGIGSPYNSVSMGFPQHPDNTLRLAQRLGFNPDLQNRLMLKDMAHKLNVLFDIYGRDEVLKAVLEKTEEFLEG